MLRKSALRCALIVLGGLLAPFAHAQNFSCRIGTQPACLDYGDQICSSRGKCVDSSSTCFDQYQCGYEGFTCKSNLTECVDEYDELLRRHNTLVDDHNAQLRQKNEVIEEYDDLVARYNGLLSDAKATATRLDEMRSCLVFATDLEDAQACGY